MKEKKTCIKSLKSPIFAERINKTTAVYNYTTTTYKEDRGTGENLLFLSEKTITKRSDTDFLYEMGTHLGNVMVVVSDRKIPVDVAPADGVIDYYTADVVSATDYFPFGSPMPGRSFNSTDYRFGMNGQEKVDEISGVGNHYTAEFWEYDSRTGRRWNPDNAFKKYPGWSPYSTFFDNPIFYTDINGNDPGKDDEETAEEKKPEPTTPGGNDPKEIKKDDIQNIMKTLPKNPSPGDVIKGVVKEISKQDNAFVTGETVKEVLGSKATEQTTQLLNKLDKVTIKGKELSIVSKDKKDIIVETPVLNVTIKPTNKITITKLTDTEIKLKIENVTTKAGDVKEATITQEAAKVKVGWITKTIEFKK